MDYRNQNVSNSVGYRTPHTGLAQRGVIKHITNYVGNMSTHTKWISRDYRRPPVSASRHKILKKRLVSEGLGSPNYRQVIMALDYKILNKTVSTVIIVPKFASSTELPG